MSLFIPTADAGVTLWADGMPAPIVVREAPEEGVKAEVVEDLKYHIEQMTGRRPELVIAGEGDEIPAPAIVLGEPARRLGAEVLHETATGDAFRLLTDGGRVLISGESVYGVSHGVYELLRALGCDWIFPGEEGEIIPRRESLAVDPLDIAKKPAFQTRDPWVSGVWASREALAEFAGWKRRQQQTLAGQPRHPKFLGGGHFWHGLIRNNRELLEENPEMRALVRKPDGTLERSWFQLEPTHPKVEDITVAYIRRQFERNDWPHDKVVTLPAVSPNDGGDYSISGKTLDAGARRIDPVSGAHDHTDVLVDLGNRILERLEDEFPNLYVGMYLYSWHADYPARYEPHPRFTINIADIMYSRYHSLKDPRSASRAYYRGILERWADLHERQGNPLSFYGYNWNLAENIMPYSKMKIWGKDLPYYYNMGVLGHNNQQDNAWSILGPHDYLMARMGWDIDLDWREVLADYCRLAFGEGAPYVEEYNLMLIETQESGGYEAGGFHSIHLIFDHAFVEAAYRLFDQAEAAAQTEVHRRNVRYFRQPVRALELYLDYRDAVTAFDFATGLEAVEALLDLLETARNENEHMVTREGSRYVNLWLKPLARDGVKYSTGDYRILSEIPDELPTLIDPHIKGQMMGFWHPELQDANRIKTRTYSSTWDAQGLAPMRQGAAWYRIRFDMPEEVPEEGIGLFLGGFEDTAYVWCNGEYIGDSGRRFLRPAPFDLTDHIRLGEENLIAVQIVQRMWCNELWLGGLMYPSFIFAGPRLDEPAPSTETLYRPLPGGAREPITR